MKIHARFVGGPLDGEEREVEYKDIRIPVLNPNYNPLSFSETPTYKTHRYTARHLPKRSPSGYSSFEIIKGCVPFDYQGEE